jgi:hypothetical protein
MLEAVFCASLIIYINKNVTVRLFKGLNLRKFFTDCFAILTQRSIRIRACFYIRLILFLKTAPSIGRKGTIVSETTN